jgi:hypothetical protein
MKEYGSEDIRAVPISFHNVLSNYKGPQANRFFACYQPSAPSMLSSRKVGNFRSIVVACILLFAVCIAFAVSAAYAACHSAFATRTVVAFTNAL